MVGAAPKTMMATKIKEFKLEICPDEETYAKDVKPVEPEASMPDQDAYDEPTPEETDEYINMAGGPAPGS